MQKSVGVLLILISCAGMGFGQSFRLTGRLRTLEMLLRVTNLLKGEIRFGNASIHDAFAGAAGKAGGEYGVFLKTVSEKANGSRKGAFENIYRECARDFIKKLGIEKEEEELFYSLGSHLGYLDLEMQLKELMLYENEVIRCTEELRREMPAKKKVYESLGILGGILLAVLIW